MAKEKRPVAVEPDGNVKEVLPGPMTQDPSNFTGEVFTIVRRPHEGFADYAVATMTIECGLVKSIVLSDPYAGFEALARLELKNTHLLEFLRKNYPGELRRAI